MLSINLIKYVSITIKFKQFESDKLILSLNGSIYIFQKSDEKFEFSETRKGMD